MRKLRHTDIAVMDATWPMGPLHWCGATSAPQVSARLELLRGDAPPLGLGSAQVYGEFDCAPALFMGAGCVFGDRGRSAGGERGVPMGVIDAQLRIHGSPKQPPDWHAETLAFDAPQRDVDGGERRKDVGAV